MSTPASNTAPSTATTPATASNTLILPGPKTLLQAAKLAIEDDRAIMLDYYRQSLNGTAFVGEDPDTKERILVKTKDEFTSLIKRLLKVDDDCLVLTENSLYVVSAKIQKRKVNVASLQEAYDSSL